MSGKWIEENISNNVFRLECQKCKCKKIGVWVEYKSDFWESNELFLKCKHCGKKLFISDKD